MNPLQALYNLSPVRTTLFLIAKTIVELTRIVVTFEFIKLLKKKDHMSR